MKKSVSFFVLLVFCFLASACAPGGSKATYSSGKEEISLKYPSEWFLEESPNHHTISIATHDVLTSRAGQFLTKYPSLFIEENAMFIVVLPTRQVQTLEEFEKQSVILPIDELQYTQIGDYYAHYYSVDAPVNYGGKLENFVTTFYDFQGPGGRIINVKVVAHSANIETARKIAEQLIASMQ